MQAIGRSLILASIVILLAAGLVLRGQSAPSLGPLANPIANAPDTTEHDTQSTTAIVKVPGTQIVVAAFTNTAVYNGSNGHMVGWARSTDNGTTWTDGGTLPASADGDNGQPSLARDNVSGRLYLAAKSFFGSSVPVFRSTDDGATWLAPVNAAPGFAGGDVLQQPWVIVDNAVGTGQGTVYVIAKNVAGGGGGSQPNGTYVSRSTDGGATFGPSPGVFMTSLWSWPSIAVGGDHAVYAFAWANLSPRAIRLRKSTDFGVTFGNVVTVAQLQGIGVDGDLGLGGGFQTNSKPQMAIDPVSGELDVVFNDKNGTDKGDIYVVTSGNGGANWDAPFRINNDSAYLGDHDQFMPTGAFTPDGRHIMVSWYDRRSDPSNSLIERWGIIASRAPGDGCCAVSPNFRISTGSWPVVIGQDTYVAGNYMGSYDQLTAGSAFFWVPWADNRLSNPQTPLPHAHQPDVRVARIPVSGPPFGDFDRDFQTDSTVFRPSNGVWYTALSNGGSTITGWGNSTDIDAQADYDGDGKTDIAVFRPSSGLWYIVQSSNNAVRVESWGQSGDIPLAGDVDGDGKADLAIFRPSNGTWFVKISSDGSGNVFGWGVNGDIPLLLDFNGEGAKDLVAYRPSTGVWYMLSPFGPSMNVGWGVSGDIPVVGDFDGDFIADPTVFRPSSGQWFVKKSTGGTMVTTWGMTGDIPVSGDFDGDGKTDVTIWRDSNGVWFSQLSSGGIGVVGWGITGDKPSGRVPGS